MTFGIEAVDIKLRFTLKLRVSKFPADQKAVEVNCPYFKLILVIVQTLAQTEIQGISIVLLKLGFSLAPPTLAFS